MNFSLILKLFIFIICTFIITVHQQQKIEFDALYGWEYTLLEPNEFWNFVPKKMVPYYHFYNAPLSSNKQDHLSPLRIISQMAREEDFVSFKLDIDTPEVELPIVLEIATNQTIARLIDEFFFEMHFHCELMEECGWGYVPPEMLGLKLDRVNAMELLLTMRTQGIRAHVWP
jgi:hypothetical protein